MNDIDIRTFVIEIDDVEYEVMPRITFLELLNMLESFGCNIRKFETVDDREC